MATEGIAAVLCSINSSALSIASIISRGGERKGEARETKRRGAGCSSLIRFYFRSFSRSLSSMFASSLTHILFSAFPAPYVVLLVLLSSVWMARSSAVLASYHGAAAVPRWITAEECIRSTTSSSFTFSFSLFPLSPFAFSFSLPFFFSFPLPYSFPSSLPLSFSSFSFSLPSYFSSSESCSNASATRRSPGMTRLGSN